MAFAGPQAPQVPPGGRYWVPAPHRRQACGGRSGARSGSCSRAVSPGLLRQPVLVVPAPPRTPDSRHLEKLARPREQPPSDDAARTEEEREAAIRRALRAPQPAEREVFDKLALSKTGQAYGVGDRVEVRDRESDAWTPGRVTATCPVRVRAHGNSRSFTWSMIRRADAAADEEREEARCRARSAQLERKLRATSALAKRRRQRQRDMTRKTEEAKAVHQRALSLPRGKNLHEIYRRLSELPTDGESVVAKIRATLDQAHQDELEDDEDLAAERLFRTLMDPKLTAEDLASLTMPELKKILTHFGLPVKGLAKADLIARLQRLVWKQRATRQTPRGELCEAIARLSVPKLDARSEALSRLRALMRDLVPGADAEAMDLGVEALPAACEAEPVGNAQTGSSVSETMVRLEEGLARIDLGPEDLASVAVEDIRKLLAGLGLPTVGDKAALVEQLQFLLWEHRALAEPGRSQLQALERLAERPPERLSAEAESAAAEAAAAERRRRWAQERREAQARDGVPAQVAGRARGQDFRDWRAPLLRDAIVDCPELLGGAQRPC